MPHKGTVSIPEIRMKNLPVRYLCCGHFLLSSTQSSQQPSRGTKAETCYHVLRHDCSLPHLAELNQRVFHLPWAYHISPSIIVSLVKPFNPLLPEFIQDNSKQDPYDKTQFSAY